MTEQLEQGHEAAMAAFVKAEYELKELDDRSVHTDARAWRYLMHLEKAQARVCALLPEDGNDHYATKLAVGDAAFEAYATRKAAKQAREAVEEAELKSAAAWDVVRGFRLQLRDQVSGRRCSIRGLRHEEGSKAGA